MTLFKGPASRTCSTSSVRSNDAEFVVAAVEVVVGLANISKDILHFDGE